jgi:hypothetical protein
MTTPAPDSPNRFITFRDLTNIAALLALVIGVDYAFAWWAGRGTYTCRFLLGFGAEGVMSAVGVGGLALAIIGVTLGGVRHRLTGFGFVLMILGAVGAALLPQAVAGACAS